MPKEKGGDPGVICFQFFVQSVEVFDNAGPAVLFGKVAEFTLVLCALPVAEMIVRSGDKAVICKELHKCEIAAAVFGNAVRDLHDGAGRAVGFAKTHENLILTV